MTKSKRKTAVGYIRVSTEEQAKEGYSLDNQEAEINRRCKIEGWDLLEVFHDKGISGALFKQRTGLNAMLKYIKENKVDYLVIYKLSRLSRKIYDVVNIYQYLEQTGTFLISTEDKIDTSTAMGKYFLVLASIFADMERENIIVQVKGGMSEKASEGEWNGGKPPLGYDLIDKYLVINEEKAQIVKLIFSEYLKGNGYKAIAAMLNQRSFKTSTGSTFSGNSVKDILKNPTYAGKIRWGHRTDWGKRHEDDKRKRKYNEEPIISDGKHEAIIDPETFNRVQELIEGNPRRNMKRFNGNHLLSGLLRCPDCDYGMSIHTVRKKGRTYEYYSCNQNMNHKTVCKPNLIRKDEIEEEFLTIFERIINDPEFKNNMLSTMNTSDDQVKELESSIKRKESEIKKLKEKQDKWFDELAEGSEEFKAALREKIQDAINQRLGLQEEIDNTLKEIKRLKDKNINLDEVSDLLKNVGKVIKLMPKEAQQSLVRKLISSIKVENKRIAEVHFSFQQGFRIGGDTGNRIISEGEKYPRNTSDLELC